MSRCGLNGPSGIYSARAAIASGSVTFVNAAELIYVALTCPFSCMGDARLTSSRNLPVQTRSLNLNLSFKLNVIHIKVIHEPETVTVTTTVLKLICSHSLEHDTNYSNC